MSVQIRSLNDAEFEALEAAIDLATHLTNLSRPLQSMQIQSLYNVIHRSQFRDPLHVIALGLSFGEELRGHGNFEWVRVIDDFGEETCIAIRGKMACCPPISVIQKRLDRDELPDFVKLREAIIANLENSVTDQTEDRE
jgi:hypothetical protein